MASKEKFNSDEKKAIEELRTRMKNALPLDMLDDAIFLHKFLVARDFDMDKAEKMLRKNIIWRKSFQVDNILKDFQPKEFCKYVEVSFVGLDKEGDMVKYAATGKIDGRDVAKCTKMNDYVKYWIWDAEQNMAYMSELKKKTGRDDMQFTFILDLDKLTIGNATSKESAEQCRRLMRMTQDNYPESLKATYIINAPAYYVIIFQILKPMMSNAMLRKIQVFGHSGWKEKLLEIIDADVLPGFLGGNRTDPDGNPLCTSFINHGGKIPEKYYLSDEERGFRDKSQVKQIVIPQKEKKEIPVNITECESVIQWEFLIKSKDIGFGLLKEISNTEVEEVLPIQKYDTTDGTELGSYRCQSTGKYIICFDNSFSWMRSKEIEYIISVVKPGS